MRVGFYGGVLFSFGANAYDIFFINIAGVWDFWITGIQMIFMGFWLILFVNFRGVV